MFNLKDLVKDGKTAKFKKYRAGVLYYETAEGFVFGIPAADLGESSLNQEERCASLMKWIRAGLQDLQSTDEQI